MGIEGQRFPVVNQMQAVDLMAELRPYAERHRVFIEEDFVGEDAWGNPIYISASGSSFVVWSNGSDGTPDPVRPGGDQSGHHRDIIATDEEWWQWMDGTSFSGPPKSGDPFEHVLHELDALERQKAAPRLPHN